MTKTSIFAALLGTTLLIAGAAPGFAHYGPVPYSGNGLETMTTYVDIDAFGGTSKIPGYGPLPYSGNGLEGDAAYVDIDAFGVPMLETGIRTASIESEPRGVPYAAWRMAMPGIAGGLLE